ncbi:MAG: GAF domain-containing protein [Chloroflexi bacterium]|nr:GAF domain-containing protein [Chloroflexota bacterium]
MGPTTDTLILLLDEFHIRMADSQNPSLIQKSITPLNQVDYLLAIDTKRFLDIPREKQSTNFVEFDNALDTAEEKPFFRVDITPNIPGDDTVAVALLKTKPWTVAYTRPTSIFLADVQQQIRTNIILVISTSIFITLLAALVARSLAGPIISLTNTANSISQGDLSARAEVRTSDEIGILASAFNSMTSQLQTTLAGLEERIGERTKDLQKSNLELETIAEVAREISIIRDLDTLLKVSTNLIRERLNYYHVGIFIVDDRNEYAHLQAASGIASEQMLSQNIKFRIDGMDPLATALRSGNVYFSPDAGKDKFLPRNPLLPDTVSEALLPLHIRNITIGALDIHAGAGVPFGERETNTLRLLADQMAAAVENAQLVRQVEGTLRELTNASRSQTRQIWKAAINQKERPGYEYDGLRIKPVPQNLSKDLLRQLESGKPIIVTRETGDANNSLLLPLTVLNQVIGVIGLENEDPNHIWSENDIAIAQAAANRASLTLENARLLEESQRRATKERAISDATSRIGSAVNMENILLATAEELERILGDSELILQINTSTTSSKKD